MEPGTKVYITTDKTEEYTALWIGEKPILDEDGLWLGEEFAIIELNEVELPPPGEIWELTLN